MAPLLINCCRHARTKGTLRAYEDTRYSHFAQWGLVVPKPYADIHDECSVSRAMQSNKLMHNVCSSRLDVL